ncbi:unnamed protein product, partial [Gulo gulo]
KAILSSQTVHIPENVDIALKGRTVVVKGPRGSLRRDFHHCHVELRRPQKSLQVDKWWGNSMNRSHFFSVCSLGFRRKIVVTWENGSLFEIHNFSGEKYICRVWMRPVLLVQYLKTRSFLE